jgi:hypothetical protein
MGGGMKLSNKVKLELFAFLIILNIILRFQVVSNEVGADSFMVHMVTNSISEFGYAKWVLHPASFIGMYPYSTESAVPFFLSSIFQCTGIEMRWVTFLYCIFLGILSMFTAYLMGGAITDDDIFKFLAAFVFSTSPAVLGYSTWTMPARGLFVVLAPLLGYMLLKCRKHIRYVPLTIVFAVFLYATHHLLYFMIPMFFAFFVLLVLFRLKECIEFMKIPRFAPSTIVSKFTTINKNDQVGLRSKINLIAALEGITKLKADRRIGELKSKLYPLIPIVGFAAMFSIPFFGRKFIEASIYFPIYISYIRYIGLLIILAVGGVSYMIFKRDKNFREWLMLLSVIFLTALIYERTYMKWFLPIFAVPFICIGLVNILRSERKRYALTIVSIFLITSLCFSGYYQFLHFSPTHGINERYMEDSTYTAGRWMKEFVTGSAISNDRYFGYRIAATSETTHHLVMYTLLTSTYGFVTVNLSQFKWYPITSEKFWFDVGSVQRDEGEYLWDRLNRMKFKTHDFNITYFAENTKAGGDVIWHHGRYPSKLLHRAYDEKDCVYDCGKVRVWDLV